MDTWKLRLGFCMLNTFDDNKGNLLEKLLNLVFLKAISFLYMLFAKNLCPSILLVRLLVLVIYCLNSDYISEKSKEEKKALKWKGREM